MTSQERRIQRLERTEILKRHLMPLEQFQKALNETAVVLTGRDFSFAEGDESTVDRIMADVRESYLPKLNDAALTSLMAELEQIAFCGDTAAMEAARREALMEEVSA
jgi:hypothetical protein